MYLKQLSLTTHRAQAVSIFLRQILKFALGFLLAEPRLYWKAVIHVLFLLHKEGLKGNCAELTILSYRIFILPVSLNTL